MSAVSRGNFEVVRYLVEHGAEVNHVNNSGKGILMSAVSGGNTDIHNKMDKNKMKRIDGVSKVD